MKKIHITGLLILGIATLSSCQKNFLDRAPETEISNVDFWNSENDMKLYANGFYSMLPYYSDFGSMGIYGLDADGSDNMISTNYNTALNGERTVPSTGGGYGEYGSWSDLRNINYFLANYTKVTAPFDNIKAYLGEALFFRSYFYYAKLKAFGALPWVNKPLELTSPEVFNERLPRNIIADSLLADLDRAISYLPTKSAAQPSRISKEVAMLFQARIALYEGTWEKYHKGTDFGAAGSDEKKYLQKAADVAGKLIESSGGYGLSNFNEDPYAYWKLFNQTDYSGNPEIMFWRAYNTSLRIGHRWHRYTTSGAGRGLTKDLIDSYLCSDGKPIALSPLYKGDATLKDVVTNRDPRMRQTIYINDDEHVITNNRPSGAAPIIFMQPTFESVAEGRSVTGYQVYKGHNPDYNQQQDLGSTGLILFRYAEALLIYAEAKAELGNLTQGDLDLSINKLRSRVKMPSLNIGNIPIDPNAEFKTLSPLLNEIRRERRIELAAEGYRRDDLFRWAAMQEKFFNWKPKGAKRAQWDNVTTPPEFAKAVKELLIDEKGYIEPYKNASALKDGYQFNSKRDYLSPIPTDQLTLNTKIKQNPGW